MMINLDIIFRWREVDYKLTRESIEKTLFFQWNLFDGFEVSLRQYTDNICIYVWNKFYFLKERFLL